MKKYMIKYLSIIGILTIAVLLCRCSDDAYSEKYANPATISEATCEKLMTGVLIQSNTWITPVYGRYFGWGSSYVGKFAQVFGFPNTSGRYEADSYGDPSGHWNDFYKSLTTFRVLEDIYSKLSDADKTDNSVFLWISQIFIYQQLTEILGAWGDLPYTEAGTLYQTGDIKTSIPKFDTQESLYTMMLNDLKTLSDNLANSTLSVNASGKLAAQDYIFHGDVMMWRRFANSLRLRLGMRLSSQGNLVNEGKAAVTEVLGNETKYPLPTDNSNMCAFYSTSGPDLKWTEISVNDPGRIQGYAAHAHISRMVNNQDPRLEVTYELAPQTGTYAGLDPSKPFNALTDEGMLIRSCYSSIDSASFRMNNMLIPGLIFSASEIWFIKAEAYQRNIAPGNAEAAFKTAIDLSVKMYYDINSGATYKLPTPLPSQADISAFANARWAAIGTEYATAEEAIAIQKWIHFGFLQEFEAWSELRRTGLPRLTYATDNGSRCPNVPDRIKYPDNERLYNPNCPRTEDDDWYTVLSWAKTDWYNRVDL
ncbi:hypothetical protein EZS27_004987 [termite gut metagenome]|uniref:SusD/RagB family nutrient-binding outer membrane lipoprotein n=1 Tax=termite gut metagenome TaxID=433724 RepID=A0A5J4SN85_9ZZZZ